ncbi:hypothetical protein ACHAWX_005920 [Stephanocyclus meneghinianus]
MHPPTSFTPTLLLTSLLHLTTAKSTGIYLPLSYTISHPHPQCLYERITSPQEHLTSSVYVIDGSELRAAVVVEGPVAPADLDLNTENEHSGVELQKYIDRYEREGPTKMFGKNVEIVHFAELVDFEAEVERYDDVPPGGLSEEAVRRMEMEQEERARRLEMQHRQDFMARRDARREHVLMNQVEKEFDYDDDFVKLQMKKRGGREMDRQIERYDDVPPGGLSDRMEMEQEGRRLQEEAILVAGEPYQKTILIKSPGWYRLCVRAKVDTIEAEMELRKSSIYGKINPKTGHVPSPQDAEIHSEIRNLYDKEVDEQIIAEEEAIKDDDFKTIHDQLRVLERVYHDIIDRQMDERRAWGWRTVHNKHLYSHMVMGNLVETVFYMIITGWQVYTIRKWFSGGPTLGK